MSEGTCVIFERYNSCRSRECIVTPSSYNFGIVVDFSVHIFIGGLLQCCLLCLSCLMNRRSASESIEWEFQGVCTLTQVVRYTHCQDESSNVQGRH